jgi:hypothetical protein
MNYVICGCVKNCEPYLDKVFNNIKKMMEVINIVQIVISFDKSTDKSYEKLLELQKTFKLDIVTNNNFVSPHRTVNIANARNNILNYLRQKKDIKIDYFIMIDCDDVCAGSIDVNILKEAVQDKSWDSISFNNIKYYDFWALSFDNYIYSCWHWNDPKQIIKIMSEHLLEKIKNTEGKLIECDSAFGGFAIYKYDTFIKYSYVPVMNMKLFDMQKIIKVVNETNIQPYLSDNTTGLYADCEHRSFHMTAKQQGAKIYIYKDCLFTPFDSEHSKFLYEKESDEKN